MYNQEQITHLQDPTKRAERFLCVVNEWVNRDNIPTNVKIVFDHILSTPRKDQTAYLIGTDLYWIDYKPKLYRYYYNNNHKNARNGWYAVEDMVRNPKNI